MTYDPAQGEPIEGDDITVALDGRSVTLTWNEKSNNAIEYPFNAACICMMSNNCAPSPCAGSYVMLDHFRSFCLSTRSRLAPV